MELLLLTNRHPEDCVYLWIDGIKNGETRKMVFCSDQGGERLTLEKAWKHAAQIEANSRLAEMRRKRRGEHGTVVNVNLSSVEEEEDEEEEEEEEDGEEEEGEEYGNGANVSFVSGDKIPHNASATLVALASATL